METRTNVVFQALEGLQARPALLFFLWSLWLAFPYFGFGPSSFVWLPDNGDAFLPMQLATADGLVRGQSGWWGHLFVSGADGLSSLRIGEPLSVLFALAPGWIAYGFVMGCQRFIAGYFTFRLMRDALALEAMPAVYAGLAYALFCQGSINHHWAGFTLYDGLVLPGLPFFLWALLRLDRCGRTVLCAGATALGVLLSVTSLYYIAVFLFPLMLVWFLWITPRRQGSFWLACLLFVLSWGLAEAPVLWATYLNSPLSFRSLWPSDSPLSDTSYLWQYHLSLDGELIRDNVLSLSLVLLGRSASASRDRRQTLLLGLLLFCLVYNLACPFLLKGVLDHLGILKGFSFDRLYWFFPFLAITSGAMGLAALGQSWAFALVRPPRAERSISMRRLVFAAAVCLLGLQSMIIQRDILVEMAEGRNFRNLYQNPSVLEAAARRDATSPFRVATLAETSRERTTHPHPGYAWAYGLETADGYVNLYPKRYHQFWEKLIEPVSQYDMESFARFRFAGTRLYLLVPSGPQPETRNDSSPGGFFRPGLLSLANVRFLISSKQVRMDSMIPVHSERLAAQEAWEKRPRRDKLFGLILGEYPGAPMYVYENGQVIPRFFLARRVQVLPGDAEILSALGEATREDLASTAYLKHSDVQGLSMPAGGTGGGTVRVGSYHADRIVLEVDARSDAILVATNNFSPFWRACVDGRETRMFPADHTFQGVPVPRGRHEVVLSYEPPYAMLPRLPD